MEELKSESEAVDVEPSCSIQAEDCRVHCTNVSSLRNILDITVKHISELADSSHFKDKKTEVVSKFTEVFKAALQENIAINGLPWMVNEKNLTSLEIENHMQNVDEAVLAHLSNAIANVAQKRKRVPEQCCRILNMKTKHELQNLKKAKVIERLLPESFSPPKYLCENRKKFSEFCKSFSSAKETVQHKLAEKERITKEINTAYNIQTRQRARFDSNNAVALNLS